MHGLVTTLLDHCPGNLPQALGRGRGDGQNGFGFALRLVDLLDLGRLRLFNNSLFLAFGFVAFRNFVTATGAETNIDTGADNDLVNIISTGALTTIVTAAGEDEVNIDATGASVPDGNARTAAPGIGSEVAPSVTRSTSPVMATTVPGNSVRNRSSQPTDSASS